MSCPLPNLPGISALSNILIPQYSSDSSIPGYSRIPHRLLSDINSQVTKRERELKAMINNLPGKPAYEPDEVPEILYTTRFFDYANRFVEC